MTGPCGDEHAFADGELDEEAHQRFAAHLPGCERCRRELENILALGALADDARSPGGQPVPVVGAAPSAERPRGGGGRRRRTVTAAFVFAAAAGLLLFALALGNRLGQRPGDEARGDAFLATLAGDSHRQLEGRLAYPGLDRHRRLNNPRAGGVGPTALAGAPAVGQGLAVEEGLAALEARDDLHGLGVAHLLLGNLSRARWYLEQAPQSRAVLVDRASLALRQGKPQEALLLTDEALREAPDQVQALWNRALALDALRQTEKAAATFDRVAALAGAGGWREEARERAGRLRLEAAGNYGYRE